VAAFVDSGFLYQRKIDKLVGGGRIDWNSGPVLKKIEETIAAVNKRGALRIKRKARSIVRQRAYDTGALMKSINAYPSKHQYSASTGLSRKIYSEWVISAGDEDEVDYARLVEVGRYFKNTGNRVAAVPFMRQAAADTRRWMRPRMIAALKAAIK
jgi:hypothetical protein